MVVAFTLLTPQAALCSKSTRPMEIFNLFNITGSNAKTLAGSRKLARNGDSNIMGSYIVVTVNIDSLVRNATRQNYGCHIFRIFLRSLTIVSPNISVERVQSTWQLQSQRNHPLGNCDGLLVFLAVPLAMASAPQTSLCKRLVEDQIHGITGLAKAACNYRV